MSKAEPTPGQMARAALDREARPYRPAGVSVPLRVEKTAHGITHLVHEETGRVMGQCASEELANKTRDFLR